MKLRFILTLLKLSNAVVVVIISMIHVQKCVFLMLLKTLMSKYSIECLEIMKRDTQNSMSLVNVNVDQMQVFAKINNVGKMINADVNAKD